MPVAEKIAESLIGGNAARAVADVFRTMLGHSVAPVGGVAAPWPADRAILDPGVQAMVGQVGLVGEINGFARLYFEETFARECIGRMLGVEAGELAALGPEAINDAVGELANMTIGSFKNGLCDAGHPCKLTIPSVLRVSDFAVADLPRWATRYVYVFEANGRRIVLDVLLKLE